MVLSIHKMKLYIKVQNHLKVKIRNVYFNCSYIPFSTLLGTAKMLLFVIYPGISFNTGCHKEVFGIDLSSQL